DERALGGAVLLGVIDEAVERVPFDVELRVRVGAKHFGDVPHIVRPNVTLIGPRVQGDAVRARIEAKTRGADDARDADGARVPQGGQFVQGDRELHEACRVPRGKRVKRKGGWSIPTTTRRTLGGALRATIARAPAKNTRFTATTSETT